MKRRKKIYSKRENKYVFTIIDFKNKYLKVKILKEMLL